MMIIIIWDGYRFVLSDFFFAFIVGVVHCFFPIRSMFKVTRMGLLACLRRLGVERSGLSELACLVRLVNEVFEAVWNQF